MYHKWASSKNICGTCTGLAATNRPATPPPTTRPSGLAKETLMPPDLLRVPPLSLGMKDPDNDRISKRPCPNKARTGYNKEDLR